LKSGIRRQCRRQKLEERGGGGGEELIWRQWVGVRLRLLEIRPGITQSPLNISSVRLEGAEATRMSRRRRGGGSRGVLRRRKEHRRPGPAGSGVGQSREWLDGRSTK
jgi:hypothetical protein